MNINYHWAMATATARDSFVVTFEMTSVGTLLGGGGGQGGGGGGGFMGGGKGGKSTQEKPGSLTLG